MTTIGEEIEILQATYKFFEDEISELLPQLESGPNLTQIVQKINTMKMHQITILTRILNLTEERERHLKSWMPHLGNSPRQKITVDDEKVQH